MSMMQTMLSSSYLAGANAAYLEAQYEAYLEDPHSVPEEWQNIFKTMALETSVENNHSAIREALIQRVARPRPQTVSHAADTQHTPSERTAKRCIAILRRYGHLAAAIDPLGLMTRTETRCKLSDITQRMDLSPEVMLPRPATMPNAQPQVALKEVHAYFEKIYCHHTGVEFEHIEDEHEREWLYSTFESLHQSDHALPAEEKEQCLHWLTEADALEKILSEKFPGQKRFSLEGGDALIPMLRHLTELAAQQKVQVVDIGMAHRGRLNVMVNVVGKPPSEVFKAFENKQAPGDTSGDVKYHLGFSSDIDTPHGPIHLSLACNPSHLEMIAPVVLGSTRARQDALQKTAEASAVKAQLALPVLIHGDAAFSGQGIAMETLALANTRAYGVGGAIRIIANNQVGFTTSDSRDARSSRYCSDTAKMIEAPIMHVNGDDPEACLRCITLAMAYRERFHKDIVIDLVCFRRHGHQEVDEPFGTQALMYAVIKKKKALREDYAATLENQGVISKNTATDLWQQARKRLNDGATLLPMAHETQAHQLQSESWPQYFHNGWSVKADTTCDIHDLKQWAKQLAETPAHFELQKQVGMLMKQRLDMSADALPIDWGMAEALAYASLLGNGHGVRLTGQDVRRGTFFHRHAAIHDQKTGATHFPLMATCREGAKLSIYDSILSEAAVLAFEYGYALKAPNNLVIWEAQFGDFANGAQVIIDQFITSGWQKWERLAGVVLQLPHGQEGQGPEHSSARLERYLQLAAEDNIQVCVPTTAKQVFHMLRRQVLRPYRRPLIVMSPKSLLRHPKGKTSFEALAKGAFEPLIVDACEQPDNIKRLIACTGKVYYDLLAHLEKESDPQTLLMRFEQLYPFPTLRLQETLQQLPADIELVWCQEEPENQGAWSYIRPLLRQEMTDPNKLRYAGRPAMAAPAVGYPGLHAQQQAALVLQACKGDTP